MNRQGQGRGNLELTANFTESLIGIAVLDILIDGHAFTTQFELNTRSHYWRAEWQCARHGFIPIILISCPWLCQPIWLGGSGTLGHYGAETRDVIGPFTYHERSGGLPALFRQRFDTPAAGCEKADFR